MKRLIAIALVVLLSPVLAGLAAADDVADVKAAVLEIYETLDSGDVDGYMRFFDLERDPFSQTGLLLTGPQEPSLEEVRNNIQRRVDAGFKYDREIQHLNVRVYGNAAVATYYRTARNTAEDGTPLNGGPDRVSMVLIKQDGQWRWVHLHASPLLPAARE